MIRFNVEKMKNDPVYRDLVEYVRASEMFTDDVPTVDNAENRSWLQMKVAAQRKVLKALNDRVYNQRIQLRLTNEAGRGLTRAEWDVARKQYERLDADLLVS